MIYDKRETNSFKSMHKELIIFDDVLDIESYYQCTKTPKLTKDEIKDRLMLFTQSSKYSFLLPVTNHGGFSHELYELVSCGIDIAKRLKSFLESLNDLSGQWMIKCIKQSINYPTNRDSEDFGLDFQLTLDVLESLIIEEKGV